jgi:hypothetical protein
VHPNAKAVTLALLPLPFDKRIRKLAKPNYDFAKRQREMAKKAKKEEKLRKKQGAAEDPEGGDVAAGETPAPDAGEIKPAV